MYYENNDDMYMHIYCKREKYQEVYDEKLCWYIAGLYLLIVKK